MKTGRTRCGLLSLLALLLALASVWGSCGQSDDGTMAIDYSVVDHWLSIPALGKEVDVFYLYPTAWHKVSPEDPNICDIDNPLMQAGSAAAFQRQATAFGTVGNIYAPFYRQADAAYTLSLPEAQRDAIIGGIPTLDATAAFEYYIEHFNNGRPFILAGHSQGSNVLLFLLSGYMKEHPGVYARMIAAYVVGYPVTQAYLEANPHLKFAEGADDAGVIISYNTQSPVVLPGRNPVVSDIVGLVINPISWTRDTSLAATSQGLGSYMPNSDGVFRQVPQYADAKIDIAQGLLICSTAVDNTLILGFGPGVYHSYDYPFYYFNLRDNAAQRTAEFLESN